MPERCLRSTVSSAAARIWRKYEADLDRRDGIDQAAAASGPARHRNPAATAAPQLHGNPMPLLSKDQSLQTSGQMVYQAAQCSASHEPLGRDAVPAQAAAAARAQHVASVDTASHVIVSRPGQQGQAGRDPAGYFHGAQQHATLSIDGTPAVGTSHRYQASELCGLNPQPSLANSSSSNAMPHTELPGASTAVQEKEDVCLKTSIAQQPEHSIQARQGPSSLQPIPVYAAEDRHPGSLGLTDGAYNSYKLPCLVLSRTFGVQPCCT